MILAFKRVFSQPIYAILAMGMMALLFLFVAWLPNRGLLSFALASPRLSFWRLIWQSPRFFAVNATPGAAVMTIIVIVLTGIYVAMLVYYFKYRIAADRNIGLGAVGGIIGLFGFGCAACGSVILSSIFGLGINAGLLGLFPFKGVEFIIVGVIILAISIILLARKITDPNTCEID